ncbi:MAG: hypothetical protein WBW49_09220, partial [Candidatus Acidiferrum sp.]
DPSLSRFKAEMPAIPGLSPRKRRSVVLPLLAGVMVIVVVLLVAFRWFSHAHHITSTRVEPAPQIEVPPAPPDPASLLPHADKANPVIANVDDLSKPWSSADFFIRDLTTGENVPATIVRLPSGSDSSPTGYWAFSRKAPYGTCQLEYVRDLEALRNGYDYKPATHPLVGNPCSHTLYDPLQTVSLPGNIWIRGAIVQGADVRPPLGVEIKIQGQQILAVRTE